MTLALDVEFSPLAGVAIAAVLGGAIGMQRQAAAKPAGFRTHLLVATAAAAFTAMGAHLHDTRIPSYIVVGIGFLGAGAIVRTGPSSRGLTTAASIWVASAIGLLLGYANLFGLAVALLTTAITLIALAVSDSYLLKILRIPRKTTIRVSFVTQRAMNDVAKAFADEGVRVESADIATVQTEAAEELVDVLYLVQVGPDRDLNVVIREIGALSGVRKVEATEPASN